MTVYTGSGMVSAENVEGSKMKVFKNAFGGKTRELLHCNNNKHYLYPISAKVIQEDELK